MIIPWQRWWTSRTVNSSELPMKTIQCQKQQHSGNKKNDDDKNNNIALFLNTLILSPHRIYPLTTRVFGAPQMISQPVSSIFPCSLLPSGTWQTLGLSIPWCCLPTSSSVCLVFFLLSLYLARWFWPDPMNGRHDYTTAVCVAFRWSGGLRVVWLPAGSRHGLPRW